jgi:hypothetical protein
LSCSRQVSMYVIAWNASALKLSLLSVFYSEAMDATSWTL